MWSPLGSSAMGSSTLRGSLSVNDIPLLLYKNRIVFPERRSSASESFSSGSTSGEQESRAEEEDGPPPVPPRKRRHDQSRIKDSRTLTPAAETGAGGLLEKGRCVSMPSVVSTPHTPRHHSLLRQNHGKTTGSNHRRFLRRFPQLQNDEGLVDYYSCALVAEILLQGILYVGERHFAFYSNIFGHKKRLLIPAQNVLKVTKERTAKFIPNAVGIATAEHKFVFASLLSRDATFKALYEVWSRCCDTKQGFTLLGRDGSEEGEVDEEDSSPSETNINAAQPALQDRDRSRDTTPLPSKAQDAQEPDPDSQTCQPVESGGKADISGYLSRMPRTSQLLIASTLLLVVLFASATVLVYRIAVVQKHLRGVAAAAGNDFRIYPEATAAHRWKAYQELSHRHNKVLSEEVGKLTNRLQEHVRHLHQMRLPLEELAATASKMPDFCTLNPGGGGGGGAQQQQQQQQSAQLTPQQTQANPTKTQPPHQEQSQWATYAAT